MHNVWTFQFLITIKASGGHKEKTLLCLSRSNVFRKFVHLCASPANNSDKFNYELSYYPITDTRELYVIKPMEEIDL